MTYVESKLHRKKPCTARTFVTHKCTDSSQKLRLHGLLFRETASNEDRVIGNFMRDLMSKACKSCSSTDNRWGIKRCSHSVRSIFKWGTFEGVVRKQSYPSTTWSWRVNREYTHASPSVLKRSPGYVNTRADVTIGRNSHIMYEISK